MDKIKDAVMAKVEPLISKIGELTRVQRYLIYGGTILLLTGIFVYVIYLPKQGEINELQEKHEKLEQQLTTARNKAMQLKKYQKMMDEAKVQFEIVKKTLPEKKDIPSLLAGISQSGRDAGLEFLLFQPGGITNKGFYDEIPVAINVTGNYHNVALFFAKVANLSRIVNIRDIKMSGGETLNTTCTAVTYRFNESESAPKGKNKKKKRKWQ